MLIRKRQINENGLKTESQLRRQLLSQKYIALKDFPNFKRAKKYNTAFLFV